MELLDRSLMLAFETWKPYDDQGPAKQSAMALFSSDGGSTWCSPIVVADGMPEHVYYWDMRIIGLGESRFFVTFWTHDWQHNKDLPIHWAASEDGGKTWTKPHSTGIEGQISCAAHLGGETIFLVYNRRHAERPGIMGILSHDRGGTWDTKNQVMIWDAQGQANIGTRSGENVFADMATFAFGKPNAERLHDGNILVSFWCTHKCVTHIRWAQIHVD